MSPEVALPGDRSEAHVNRLQDPLAHPTLQDVRSSSGSLCARLESDRLPARIQATPRAGGNEHADGERPAQLARPIEP